MFLNPSPAITANDIDAIEKALQVVIPKKVQEHYLAHNGGMPRPNCYWFIGDGIEWHRIRTFFPMKYPEGGRTLEKVYRLGIDKDDLIRNLVPFADDEGGNYFCFDETGRVFFYPLDAWDHELSRQENKEKTPEFLCSSFQAFVLGLAPNPEDH